MEDNNLIERIAIQGEEKPVIQKEEMIEAIPIENITKINRKNFKKAISHI